MRRHALFGKSILAIGLIALLASPALPAEAGSPSCQTVRIPVTVGDGPTEEITGSLCVPDSYPGGVHRVDLLVHGGTYSSIYWNWPVESDRYSYVRKTVRAGRAAFTFERPGTVAGTLPPSSSLTADGDADRLHQLLQWLRGDGFDQVTLIGHSLGSIMSITETAKYNDADRLVVTGLLHHVGDAGPIPMYQASLDPLFAGVVTDPGYVTTEPGVRGNSFYDLSTADPDVVAYDEAHKDVLSADEAVDNGTRVQVPAGQNDSNRIRIPVLTVIGQKDRNFCGTDVDCSTDQNVQAAEAPYYTSAPSLTAQTVPDSGHSLPLNSSASVSFAGINQWINAH